MMEESTKERLNSFLFEGGGKLLNIKLFRGGGAHISADDLAKQVISSLEQLADGRAQASSVFDPNIQKMDVRAIVAGL